MLVHAGGRADRWEGWVWKEWAVMTLLDWTGSLGCCGVNGVWKKEGDETGQRASSVLHVSEPCDQLL